MFLICSSVIAFIQSLHIPHLCTLQRSGAVSTTALMEPNEAMYLFLPLHVEQKTSKLCCAGYSKRKAELKQVLANTMNCQRRTGVGEELPEVLLAWRRKRQSTVLTKIVEFEVIQREKKLSFMHLPCKLFGRPAEQRKNFKQEPLKNTVWVDIFILSIKEIFWKRRRVISIPEVKMSVLLHPEEAKHLAALYLLRPLPQITLTILPLLYCL